MFIRNPGFHDRECSRSLQQSLKVGSFFYFLNDHNLAAMIIVETILVVITGRIVPAIIGL